MSAKKRPPIRIRFTYNNDTGEIEEFIIDDNMPGASETYHNKVAEIIAFRLGHEPDITDAGPIRLRTEPPVSHKAIEKGTDKDKEEEREEESE